MSLSSHSVSTDSVSSSNTVPTNQSNEQEMDPSNILYNDHQNYRSIFTNDSRFFDTSLHLYKSYRKLGYIQSEKKISKKNQSTTTTTHDWKPQSKGVGFRSHYETDGLNDATLKPTKSRSNGNNYPNPTKMTVPKLKEANSLGGASYQRPLSTRADSSDDSSDDPDIIITRL